MIRLLPVLSTALLVLFISRSWGEEARIWTDVKGRAIKASIVSADQKSVVIRRATDKKEFTLALTKLSESDRFYVAVWLEESQRNPSGENSESAKEQGLEGKWPHTAPSQAGVIVKVLSEDKDTSRYVYETPHFVITSELALDAGVRGNLAMVLESGRNYIRSTPLVLFPPKAETDGNRNEVLLFESKENYLKSGGAPHDKAVLHGTNKGIRILMLFTDEDRRDMAKAKVYRQSICRRTILHELTHQMDVASRNLHPAETWWMEGFANYIGLTPLTKEGFDDDKLLKGILDFVIDIDPKTNDGLKMGKRPKVSDLKSFLLAGRNYPDRSQIYGMSLLLAYYFINVDGDGDRVALNGYLEARRDGKTGEELITPLLNGRSWSELENEVNSFWKKKGINISFE